MSRRTVTQVQTALRAAFPGASFLVARTLVRGSSPRRWVVGVTWRDGPSRTAVRVCLEGILAPPAAPAVLDHALPLDTLRAAAHRLVGVFGVRIDFWRTRDGAGPAYGGVARTRVARDLTYGGLQIIEAIEAAATGLPLPALTAADLGGWLASPVPAVRLAGLRAAAAVGEAISAGAAAGEPAARQPAGD